MNIEELLNKLKQVEEEKQNIINENDKLKQLLQNYNDSRKNYYEKNKEIIKAKAKQGLKKLADENPDKLKEYRRNAYLKRKEKLMKIENKQGFKRLKLKEFSHPIKVPPLNWVKIKMQENQLIMVLLRIFLINNTVLKHD